ncbi:hypothetical protein QOZ73_33145, partial [Pseudomonas aeruginosa]|uniref:hypothetical protein n=1 Tax=Pseudomonas aeruginosa TaxID=287 RepID=UPI003459C31C
TCMALLSEYSKNPQIQIDLVTSSVDEKFHLLKMGENITVHRIPISKDPKKLVANLGKEPWSFVWAFYKYSRKLAKKNF